MADLLDFLPLYPDQDEDTIRARWAAWANEGVDPETEPDQYVDTREGTFFQIATEPGVREAARIYDLMGTEVVSAAFPAFAFGQYLDYHGDTYSLDRQAAAFAAGNVLFVGDAATVIGPGTRVTVEPADVNDDPPSFEVTVGGTIPASLGAPATPSTAAIAGGLAAGQTYRWVVTAQNALGETLASGEATFTIGGSPGGVRLDWPDVPGATYYGVYRATGAGSGGPYNRLNEVAVSTYDDTGANAENAALHPPTEDGTTAILLAVTATEAGEGGNVAAEAVTLQETPVSGVRSVSNPAAIVGGTEEESDESFAERILGRFRDTGSWNEAGYESVARAFTGVGRATIIPEGQGPGTVIVILMTADGDPVSSATVETVQNALDPPKYTGTLSGTHNLPVATVTVDSTSGARDAGFIRLGDPNNPQLVQYTGRTATTFTGCSGGSGSFASGSKVYQGGRGGGLAPIGHHVLVKTALALAIDVAMTVEPEPGYSIGGTGGTIDLTAAIRAAIEAYINAVEPGEEVVRQRVAAAAIEVTGVHDVSVPTLNGGGNVAVSSNPAQAPFLDDLTLTQGLL